MNIKIISHKTLVNAINARDLHSELEVETRFNDWIIRKIEQYHFIENEDFVSFTQKRVKPQGGRPPRDYFDLFPEELIITKLRCTSIALKTSKEETRVNMKLDGYTNARFD